MKKKQQYFIENFRKIKIQAELKKICTKILVHSFFTFNKIMILKQKSLKKKVTLISEKLLNI